MPEYIKLCMATWKFPYTILSYENLHNYIDIPLDKLMRFTLPQIADYIRVHILRDYGGYWLDTDTIMLDSELPDDVIFGNNETRDNTIGFLQTTPHSDMFVRWAEYQDVVINQPSPSYHWDVMGNAFTDNYLKEHTEVFISDITEHWAETYMITSDTSRRNKYRYQKFYFESNFTLNNIRKTNMLMLHNSWTPDWYKKLSKTEVLSKNCTLTNILRGLGI